MRQKGIKAFKIVTADRESITQLYIGWFSKEKVDEVKELIGKLKTLHVFKTYKVGHIVKAVGYMPGLLCFRTHKLAREYIRYQCGTLEGCEIIEVRGFDREPSPQLMGLSFSLWKDLLKNKSDVSSFPPDGTISFRRLRVLT